MQEFFGRQYRILRPRMPIGEMGKKKACMNRPMITIWLYSADAVRKSLTKPSISKWVIVACVRKSYRVGIFDPSRPDFPRYGYRFFQIIFQYAHSRVQPALLFIPNFGTQIKKKMSAFGSLLNRLNVKFQTEKSYVMPQSAHIL